MKFKDDPCVKVSIVLLFVTRADIVYNEDNMRKNKRRPHDRSYIVKSREKKIFIEPLD